MKSAHDRKRRLWGQAAAWAAAFFVLPLVVQAAEAQPPAQAQSQEDSLKALEARAKRLAQQGLPQKTAEDRQKESKPIIPEDCTIEVVGWHPADPQKQTETVVYEIRGGVVTARLPPLKEPEIKGETFRREGYEVTRTFEGKLQGNVIEGLWTHKTSQHHAWGWRNTDGKLTSHDVIEQLDLIKLRMEFHLDGTCTAETSGEKILKINRLLGRPGGLDVHKIAWPNENTPPEARQPGQGVWQFRSGPSAVVGEPKPSEPTPPAQKPKPSEPRIVANDPPTKFRLPPEKPAPAKPAPTPQGRRAPTDEPELDDLPPEARRLFDALPQERKKLFNKYHTLYGLGWKRSGKLLHWLADPKLPMQELEVRGRLLLITDARYQQFYKTVASSAADNKVDGALWKQAAKIVPAVKYAELVADLATTPYELSVMAAEYQDAADADRVLEKFVASYGKSEAEIAENRRKTKDAIKAWNTYYQQAQTEYRKALEEASSADAAATIRLEKELTVLRIEKELKELDLEFKALTLRLKTIRGDWQSWVVRWEK